MTEADFKLGALEARQAATAENVAALRENIAAMDAKLNILVAQMASASGAWKTLMAVGAFGGSIGAIIAAFFGGFWRH